MHTGSSEVDSVDECAADWMATDLAEHAAGSGSHRAIVLRHDAGVTRHGQRRPSVETYDARAWSAAAAACRTTLKTNIKVPNLGALATASIGHPTGWRASPSRRLVAVVGLIAQPSLWAGLIADPGVGSSLARPVVRCRRPDVGCLRLEQLDQRTSHGSAEERTWN
jgi:hypothetical protein